MNCEDSCGSLRRAVYWILATVSVGIMLGRILAVDSVDVYGVEKDRLRTGLAEKKKAFQARGLSGPELDAAVKAAEVELRGKLRYRRPFLSANDRSRWCTVRALVEADLRVEDAPYAIDKVIQEPQWDTIDMVKHARAAQSGEGHLYSSKPALYPTLMAGEYWVIHRLTGATLGTHPYAIGRFMLVTLNVLPMVVYFWLLAQLLERLGQSDWGRLFVMAAAAFGTFLTTFAVVANNHVPGAVCAMITLYAAVRIVLDGQRQWWLFAAAGLFGAFMVADELPALSLFAAVSAAVLWKAPVRTLAAYVPAAAVIVAGFFVTNWIAHRDLRPPYLHRSKTNLADNWYHYEYERNGRKIQSYWQDPKGWDRGEPSMAAYATHMLIGHHGIFSLTPVWILSVIGLGAWLVKPNDPRLRQLALLIGAVSGAVLVFCLTSSEHRNYGGNTCGFRWVFWLAPLWLVAAIPAADMAARRGWTKLLALTALGISVLSAAYATWNPWTDPWIADWMTSIGWL